MLGLFGTSVIGIDPLTGPTGDSGSTAARFARHDVLRGPPVFQDLGDDAATRSINFFFDETFCTPELEVLKMEAAFRERIPMRLFVNVATFRLGVFVIQSLSVKRQKTSQWGRLVRAELSAELIETGAEGLDPLKDAGAAIGRAIDNPFLKRAGS